MAAVAHFTSTCGAPDRGLWPCQLVVDRHRRRHDNLRRLLRGQNQPRKQAHPPGIVIVKRGLDAADVVQQRYEFRRIPDREMTRSSGIGRNVDHPHLKLGYLLDITHVAKPIRLSGDEG